MPGRLLSRGSIALQGVKRKRNLPQPPNDTPEKRRSEQIRHNAANKRANDAVIRFQQQNFPVIDYHVHLKGGLTKEMAQAMSMNYGINYGVAPNAGEVA